MTDEEMAIMASYENDPEMAAAILQSKRDAERATLVVPDEPTKDADPDTITTLQIRCPDGSRLLRRFLRATTKVSDVVNYVKLEKGMGLQDVVKLGTTFPKRVLEEPDKTLAEVGLGKQESFNVIIG
jgi:hypothetical protein